MEIHLIVAGVLFNVVSRFFPRRGIDSLPAVPIIVGYTAGSAEGLWAGIIISVAYCIINPKSLAYSPLIVMMNALAGAAAGFLHPAGFLMTGILVLVFYHTASTAAIITLSRPGPGYFLFMTLNIATSAVIFYAASLFL